MRKAGRKAEWRLDLCFGGDIFPRTNTRFWQICPHAMLVIDSLRHAFACHPCLAIGKVELYRQRRYWPPIRWRLGYAFCIFNLPR